LSNGNLSTRFQGKTLQLDVFFAHNVDFVQYYTMKISAAIRVV